MPRKNRLLSTLLLLAVLLSLTGTALAKHHHHPANTAGGTPGDFDYYLFTLSWAPQFCATHAGGAASSECDPRRHYAFVVHGLWPQNNDGSYPENCAPAQPVSQQTVQHMLPIMPNRGLIQHEWATHGTCSGLATQDYFEDIEKEFGTIQVPGEYHAPAQPIKASPAEIEQEFGQVNHAPTGAFRVSCSGSEFVGMEVCLTKDLQYLQCPASVHDCRAPQVTVRPLP